MGDYSNEISFIDKKCMMSIKGIAIILMVFHHLFGFPELLMGYNTFIGFKLFSGELLVKVLATSARICVTIFAFSTGYGMAYKYKKLPRYKEIIEKLWTFLLMYWKIMFIVLLPIRFLMGGRFSILEIVENMFGINNNIAGVVNWYVHFYILLMFTYPVISVFLQKISFNWKVALIAPVLFVYIVRVAAYFMKLIEFSNNNWLVVALYEYTFWVVGVLVGNVFSKFGLFLKFDCKFGHNFSVFVCTLGIIITIIIRSITGIAFLSFNLDIFYVPVFIYLLVKLLGFKQNKAKNVLCYFGKHSVNLWFLHYIFLVNNENIQSIIYFWKVPLIIIAWCFLLIFPVSFILNKITFKNMSILFKKLNMF